MFLIVLGALAAAQEVPADPAGGTPAATGADPASTGAQPAATGAEPAAAEGLEARVEALERKLAEAEQRALLAEAAALADASPPPQPAAVAPNVLNPRLTAFGDVLGSAWVEDDAVLPGSGLWLRSLELDVRADVDPFAKAVAVLAFEQEPPMEAEPEPEPVEGEEEAHGHGAAFSAVPEEVYLDLVALPAGLSARLGQSRQPFGISNKAHPHDLPWTYFPLPVAAILGEEGYADVGALLAWRVPNPWGTGLTLEGGALAGQPWKHEPSAVPGWLGRAEVFQTVGRLDVALGGSATGAGEHRVGGADLMIRYRASQWRSVTLIAEALGDVDGQRGGYAAVQLQPTRPLYVGLRGDVLRPVAPDCPGNSPCPPAELTSQAGGYVSYYTSEFLRVRAGAMVASTGDVQADAQLTFVWGSHPVEPYWVNR